MRVVMMFNPWSSWPAFLLTAGLGLVALFVLLDPGPSRGLGLLGRVLFWALHVLGVLALAQFVQVLLLRVSFRRPGGTWMMIAMAAAIASALFVPVAMAVDQAFPFGPEGEGTEAISVAEVIEEWVRLAPAATLVWLGLNAARFLRLSSAPPNAAAIAPVVGTTAPPAFVDRLPADRRGDLIALSAELHYLRVYTTRGETLLLYGFGEALEDMAPDTGVQIHRSHWVARRFVRGLLRDGTRLSVEMTNGLVLPVARSRRAAVMPVIEAWTSLQRC